MSEQFPLTSAEDLRAKFNHLKTKPVHPQFFSQGVIEAIQLEAIRYGMAKAAEIAETTGYENCCKIADDSPWPHEAILAAAKEFKL